MCVRQPDAWTRQDGQIVVAGREGVSHVQRRWDERVAEHVDEAWVGHPVRMAWREADPLDSGWAWAKRAHRPTGMVLVSELGILQTAYYVEQYRSDSDSDIGFMPASEGQK